MNWIIQLVPQEFRRGNITLNAIDSMSPLPTCRHSFQWSISTRFHGSKFSLLFFITAGILQHLRGGERRGGTNTKYLSNLAPDSYNLHDPPLYYIMLERFLPLSSETVNSFRLIIRVCRNPRARVQLTYRAAIANKERKSFNEETGGYKGFTRKPASSIVTTGNK